MVKDDTVSPGYRLLQAIRSDLPFPEQQIRNEHYSRDHSGRVLLRHSRRLELVCDGRIRHGPAAASILRRGVNDVDGVHALHCSAWPQEADSWLQQQNASGWPTEDMKRYSAELGCFIVPVASKAGVYPNLEWRISTSLAERCLMWNLNITQLGCYILMKMIIKTFLKPKCGEAEASFMCKNILFRCIADSRASCEWTEDSLVTWLNQCLQALLHCILTENCPHFIIPHTNNLLAGKLSAEVKHQLADVMCKLNVNIEQSLLAIKIDDLGNRLTVKSSGIAGVHLKSEHDIAIFVAEKNIYHRAHILYRVIMLGLKECEKFEYVYQILTLRVSELGQISSVGSRLEQAAISLYMPFICNYIGSIKASVDLGNFLVISHEALRWFSCGLNSDISSGKLKLASALYCAGDLGRCETLLGALQLHPSQKIVFSECSCSCNHYVHVQDKIYSEEFAKLCYEKNENVIKHNMAFCLAFLPCEVNCIPSELKYEMFRSTEEDRIYRDVTKFWMDWAVVDPVSYLYFLQYNVYSQLHRRADQQQALDNLIRTIDTEPNLGHRETALNLVGKCMEHENRHDEALRYYTISLNLRARNNAAKWHVCILLSRRVNRMSAQT